MSAPAATPEQIEAIQRRTVRILAFGQVLGGIGFGATISLGALLAADLSGDDALSGLATASVTLGAALASIPLARFASRYGRRLSLTLGNLLALVGIGLVITAAGLRLFPLLIVAVVLIGMGNAGNLQSRFAATDLAVDRHRSRDLSVVVWSTTVGGVVGPLLVAPGEVVGQAIGMPPLTGSYFFSLIAQSFALVLYLVALRPDPLLLSLSIARGAQVASGAITGEDRPVVARYAIFAVSGSHAVMVAVMAMTPIHLSHLAHASHGHATTTEDVTSLVSVTIALHVAGMYALSPVFGLLADRWGRVQVVLLGQLILAASLGVAILENDSAAGVMVALILLGLGWSAATVAGASLLTEASEVLQRPKRQGISDSLMSLTAAAGAAGAGLVLANFGYGGLAWVALTVVVAITALSPLARRAASAHN